MYDERNSKSNIDHHTEIQTLSSYSEIANRALYFVFASATESRL